MIVCAHVYYIWQGETMHGVHGRFLSSICLFLWSHLLCGLQQDSSGGKWPSRVGETPADDNGSVLGDNMWSSPARLTEVLQTSHIRTEEGGSGRWGDGGVCHQAVIAVLVAQHKWLHLNLHIDTQCHEKGHHGVLYSCTVGGCWSWWWPTMGNYVHVACCALICFTCVTVLDLHATLVPEQ